MLTIKTDIQNQAWLRYILDEFICINLATFDIRIQNVTDSNSENVLYYTRNILSHSHASIYCSNSPNPGVHTVWLFDNLFVFPETMTQENFFLNYDLFWNAFVFLSRLEEYQADLRGIKITSYCSRHPRLDKSTFLIPIVNVLFNELAALIKQYFPELKFHEKRKPFVQCSHDVDYINKTFQLRIKHAVFHGYQSLKTIVQPKVCWRNIKKTVRFLVTNPSYWCFDYWAVLEKEHNIRSVFYIYAKSGERRFKAWLIDPSYEVSTNERLKNKLKELLNDGFEIGLHGSYFSAVEEGLLKKEKQILESVLNHKIKKTRQHWLNYDEKITPYLHESLFQDDSTLGWNDQMGFRSGCASQYRPFDHDNQRPFVYLETPQIMMDSHIFDYACDKNEAEKQAYELLSKLSVFKASYVSISWHQRVFSDDYQWHKVYEHILRKLHDI
ncbi:MAG: hypothetical protein A2X77_04790 [Gammaproteobacteria bacterium GWE2_42_36]|nr:MAG: hypothetical protein A2X77_04790 [Gammaproteobacteria bacterium GWE2_42_36]